MQYSNVCIESFGYTLPNEIWSTDEIEKRLEPLYSRLKLPSGRLELMTGITERRFWPRDLAPSQPSISSSNSAISASGISRDDIGCLIHGSVCRDYLEPATSCTVHHQLGLRHDCVIYDVSNACLGVMNGMLQAANMIELGQINAALVVGTESARQLVETTIDTLNRDETITRKSIKTAIASLTIGSASCAVILTNKAISTTGNRLIAASLTANTCHNKLCQILQDQGFNETAPLMATDSEQLLIRGIETGEMTMGKFLDESKWGREVISKTVCHQVGGTHRKLMLESLGMPLGNDYATFPWLGNTGAVALPITMAVASEKGFIETGDRVGMFGIGSGINCLMMGVEWNRTQVNHTTWPPETCATSV